jgi:multicomponent Na+:H+ antiporter subunit G
VTALGILFLLLGVLFLTAGTIGLVRLPDFFTRLHAIGKSDTLGAALSLLGVACLAGFSLVALKLAIIALFVFIANPTATHAIARAAALRGIQPWRKEEAPK